MRARRSLLAVASVAAFVVPMLGAGAAYAAASDNANCVGAFRSTMNSNGGAWEHGAFGQIQKAYVANDVANGVPYGQDLQNWKSGCS